MAATTSLRIRRRNEHDCEIVVSWIRSARDLYFFTGPRLRWPLAAEQLRDMEQITGHSAWVLIDDASDVVVGHFDLTLQDSTARLGRVIIDPERRGEGLAHALVSHAISLVRQSGASSLALNVIVRNDPAIRVYERAGFCKTSDNPRPDVYSMTLRLNATRE